MRQTVKAPIVGQGLSANWGRQVARDARANRVIGGLGVSVSYTPNGTRVALQSEIDKAKRNKYFPFKVIPVTKESELEWRIYLPSGSVTVGASEVKASSIEGVSEATDAKGGKLKNWYKVDDFEEGAMVLVAIQRTTVSEGDSGSGSNNNSGASEGNDDEGKEPTSLRFKICKEGDEEDAQIVVKIAKTAKGRGNNGVTIGEVVEQIVVGAVHFDLGGYVPKPFDYIDGKIVRCEFVFRGKMETLGDFSVGNGYTGKVVLHGKQILDDVPKKEPKWQWIMEKVSELETEGDEDDQRDARYTIYELKNGSIVCDYRDALVIPDSLDNFQCHTMGRPNNFVLDGGGVGAGTVSISKHELDGLLLDKFDMKFQRLTYTDMSENFHQVGFLATEGIDFPSGKFIELYSGRTLALENGKIVLKGHKLTFKNGLLVDVGDLQELGSLPTISHEDAGYCC